MRVPLRISCLLAASGLAAVTGGCGADPAPDDVSESGAALTSYCAINRPGASSEEWIRSIQLGSIHSVSDGSPTGYSDFSDLRTQLVAGSSATLVVQAGFAGSALWRTEHWKAWLDVNGDGVFNDAALGSPGSERLFPAFTTAADPGAVVFTVPSGPPGPRRLRILMTRMPPARASWQSPCHVVLGEIEDYTIDLASQ